MESSALLDTFRAAVAALYGPDLAARQQANLWLNSFAGTAPAWEAALSLLQPAAGGGSSGGSSLEVLFFAANLLLTKIRNDWGKLNQEQREHITLAVGYVG